MEIQFIFVGKMYHF